MKNLITSTKPSLPLSPITGARRSDGITGETNPQGATQRAEMYNPLPEKHRDGVLQ